jgi:hypothetical protein
VSPAFEHARRPTRAIRCGDLALGGEEPVRVELDLGAWPALADGADDVKAAAGSLARSLDAVGDVRCESLSVDAVDEPSWGRVPALRSALDAAALEIPLAVRIAPALLESGLGVPEGVARLVVPVDARMGFATLLSAAGAARSSGVALEWCLRGEPEALPPLVDRVLEASAETGVAESVIFSVRSDRASHAVRLLAARLATTPSAGAPIVLRHTLPDDAEAPDAEAALVAASVDLGAPLCDGLGDAVALRVGRVDPGAALDLAYRILQAARLRTTRTEYISCPSCGRTLFDLEETTARIKAATGHLTGVKIAVMGCIVNGPGEMADADYGYVGSGPGKVTLYVGKDVVARNIPEAEATERLVALIGRPHGSGS